MSFVVCYEKVVYFVMSKVTFGIRWETEEIPKAFAVFI